EKNVLWKRVQMLAEWMTGNKRVVDESGIDLPCRQALVESFVCDLENHQVDLGMLLLESTQQMGQDSRHQGRIASDRDRTHQFARFCLYRHPQFTGAAKQRASVGDDALAGRCESETVSLAPHGELDVEAALQLGDRI